MNSPKKQQQQKDKEFTFRPNSPDDVHKHSSSKYDFVKVRVWLSNRHYYVLSRFLMSRVLTAIKVDYGQAIRIALDLKKELVDKEALDISQEVMENDLFMLLNKFGYGEETIKLYKMYSRSAFPLLLSSSFQGKRMPII